MKVAARKPGDFANRAGHNYRVVLSLGLGKEGDGKKQGNRECTRSALHNILPRRRASMELPLLSPAMLGVVYI